MKNKILLTLIAILFVPFLSVYAEGKVLVYPTIHNGYIFAKDITTRIEYQGGIYNDSQKGVPTYSLSSATIDPVDYIVKFLPPSNYAYSLRGDCSGTITSTETKTCYVDYTTDIPEGYVAPQNYVEPVVAPVVAPVVVVPAVTPSASAESVQAVQNKIDDQTQLIVSLKAQIIELLNVLIGLLNQQIAL